jgi:hypothetical protein
MNGMSASAISWKHEQFKQGVPIPYRTTFDTGQFARLKIGLVPLEMEDKWFIYFEEPHLFLHRSWTGQPVYKLTLKSLPIGAEVIEALWSETGSPDFDSEYQARLLDFLIANLLLGQSKQFPVPPGLTEPMPGVFQHHVSGTGYPQSSTHPAEVQSAKKATRRWWRIW